LDKIIGLDFSLNSPGVAILSVTDCKWISLHRTSNKIDKMLEKDGSPFNVLKQNASISISLVPKKEFDGEYHDKERQKILNAIWFSDLLLEMIDPYLEEQTSVGMEGLSFGSSGNSLIDISMTTALVRSAIVKRIDPLNFFVISPTTLKKFAVKGNSKKHELYDALLEKRGDDTRLHPLTNLLRENKSKWVKGNDKVENPCSDLVDATWLALYVEENLKKLSGQRPI